MKDEFENDELREFGAAVREWSADLDTASPRRAELSAGRGRPARTWGSAPLWLAAGALAVAGLIAGPVYVKARHDRARTLEAARQNERLMEQIDADLARPAPVALEPLTQLVRFPSNGKETK